MIRACTRREWLLALLLCAPLAAQRPNIVFILTDDQRYDALSIAGHAFVQTPNIDRIAKEGARFRNAFVTTPLCSPSRASFLTGQYVHTHRVTGNGDNAARSHELVTFPRLLRDAGYETAYMGKWHMGTDDSPRPGFDRWVSFRGQGQYVDPALNIDGTRTKVEGYVTDILNGHAVEFIRRSRQKPFALYLAHKAVHGPFTPAERHKNLFADQRIDRAPSAQDTLEGKPMLRRPVEKLPPVGPGTGSGDDLIRNQLRTLLAVDEGVGQIYRALEETRQLENTVFVFASDNGYIWGEHGLGDKRPAYEESIRIPLLVRYPKLVRAGTLIDQFALNIDLAPTFLDIAGVRVPRETQGRSLRPLLGGNTRGWRTSFLSEYFMETNFPRIPSWQAVRNQRWKYIHYTDLEGMDELYDLERDRYEMRNLIAEPSAQGTLKLLKAELEKLLRETGPKMALIPGGSFRMGDDNSFPYEGPAHRVTLQPFWIDTHEVTVAEFAEFASETHYKSEAERFGWSGVFDAKTAEWIRVDRADWRHPEGPAAPAAKPDEPVAQVSWNDAAAYAKWAGKRLPTEAEWEMAARGGVEGRKYVWGSQLRPHGKPAANWWQGLFPTRNTGEDGFAGRAPVGSFAPNEYGLHDMAGNVWEWCSDWYDADYYAKGPAENPRGPSRGVERVMRGGSFLCSENYCTGYRIAARSHATPDSGLNNLGFRCAR